MQGFVGKQEGLWQGPGREPFFIRPRCDETSLSDVGVLCFLHHALDTRLRQWRR